MPKQMTGEQALRNLRNPKVLHPMLLALCPIVGLYAQNADRLPMGVLLRPAVILITASLALWIVLGVALGSRYRSGLIASTLILGLVVLWGPLEDLIQIVVPVFATWPPAFFYAAYAVFGVAALAYIVLRLRTGRGQQQRYLRTLFIVTLVGFTLAAVLSSPLFGRRAAFLITGYLILLVMAVVTIWRHKGDFHVATRMANWFAAILLGLYAVVVFVNMPGTALAPVAPIARADEAPAATPDIYCIVLDGYPRSDVLRTTFAYNNLPFEQFLADNGFAIVPGSRANYSIGLVSVASMLNAAYIGDFVAPEDAQSAGMPAVLGLYRDNRVFDFLKQQGYRIVSFSPGLESIEPGDAADELIRPPRSIGEFEMVFLNRTFVSRLMQGVYYFRYRNPAYWRFEFRRRRILHFANNIGEVARDSTRPKFVLSHLLIPDPPFLFSRDGGRAQPFGEGSLGIDQAFRASPEEYVAAYREQLHFTNRLVQQAVESILAESDTPPVIILVSGNGTRFSRGGPEAAQRDVFANLIAIHAPGQEALSPPRGMSLVNVFRLVLGRELGAELELLPDQVFESSEARPFATERVLY